MLCVVSVSLSSCVKKDGVDDNNSQGEIDPPADCKPGDDFYSYANAAWLKSIENADPQQSYGWGSDMDKVNDARIEAIKASMPEYEILYNNVANCEKNFDASIEAVTAIVQDVVANIKTKEDACVAFGKAIRLGIPTAATLHTAICQDDNTIGYCFALPVPDNASLTGLHSSDTAINHHQPLKKYKRYTPNTRNGKSTIDYILEGIGLDPQHFLFDENAAQAMLALQQLPLQQLQQSIAESIQIELLIYCSDEYAQANSNGAVNSVKECIDKFMEKDLGYFTSYYFSNKYPTDSSEAAFSALGTDIAASFRKRLENNKWLSPSTQQAAIEKLDYMAMNLGSPKKWPVTEMPKLESALLVENVLKVKECRYKVIESLLGKDLKEYLPIYYMFFSPLEDLYTYLTNAFYEPTTNSFYVLPPFMMEPAYSADMDDSKFYGILGSVIGHEITHGFDQLGATYDKYGEQENWWTESDLAKFTELNERIIESVGAFEVIPGLPANSRLTVTEDVADLGGVNIAYDLWVSKLKERGVTSNELIKQKKRFFLNYAVLHSEKIPVEELIENNEKDVHSAAHIRINSVVQHIDEWYELFNVVEGDALYLAPEKRITIW